MRASHLWRGPISPDLRRRPWRVELHLRRGDLDANAARLDRVPCPGLRLLWRRAGDHLPDNLRSGVTKACRYEPELNPTYADLARHSPDSISTVSEAVLAEVTAWQSRPLEPLYPVVFFDALRVKIREDAVVRNKAVDLALGVRTDGTREIRGLWIEQTEGAKFWLKVFNELRTRGVMDVLIAVVDGLKGLAEAIGTVFPQTTVQTCIVHLIRNSLDYVSWKDRKAVAAAIRPIYTAPTEAAAHAALDAFEASPWGTTYAPISGLWRRAWNHVTPFFAFPPEVRRILYTTNAIESVHMRLRKIIKTRGHFPTDEAATKLLWLALRNITAGWSRATRDWKAAMNQFAILYAERFNPSVA